MEFESTSVKFGSYSAILIPKNANWWLVSCSGKSREQGVPKDTPTVCLLRDPAERWATGVAQFLSRRNLNREWIEDEILETLRVGWFLDPHTMPQNWFLKDIDISTTTWFWLDNNFTKNFYTWCNNLNIPVVQNLEHVHKTVPGSNKHKIKQHYMDLLPKLTREIKTMYADDYKLIESVNFYEAR